ncbi:corticotropin-releasing factor-binding protein isoform X3 [Lepus europaeus]|uniref:corticotropin-releasing factor-binding protein isoform X3 n=1 Tax=Lepus europaeus TaxID=9983 RepID=UPI002B45966E|nr:corticotropin-releasing factor-binding protein isoform X3 [Lepus europaeus]
MAEARSSPRRHACSVARPEIRRHAELIHVGPSVPPPASLRRDVCLIRSSLSLSLPWTGAEPGFHSLGSQEHPGWLQNSPVCAPRVCLSRPGLAGAAASEVVETRLLSVGGCARSTSGSPDQEFQTQVRSLHRERGGKTGQCRCGGAHSLTPVIPVAADRRTFSDLLSSFVYLRLDQRKATEITNTSFSRCLDLKGHPQNRVCAVQDAFLSAEAGVVAGFRLLPSLAPERRGWQAHLPASRQHSPPVLRGLQLALAGAEQHLAGREKAALAGEGGACAVA